MSPENQKNISLPGWMLDKTVWEPRDVAVWLERMRARRELHRTWLDQMQQRFIGPQDRAPLAMARDLFGPMADLLEGQWQMIVEGGVGKFTGWSGANSMATNTILEVCDRWKNDEALIGVSRWYGDWLRGLGMAAVANTSTQMRKSVEKMRGASGRLYRAGVLTPLLVVSDYAYNPDPGMRVPLNVAEVEFYVGKPVKRSKELLKLMDQLIRQFDPTKKRKSRTNMIMEFVTGSGQIIFSLASGQAISRGMMLFVNALETIPGLEKMCQVMGMSTENVAGIVENNIYMHEAGHGLYPLLIQALDECAGDVPALVGTSRLYENNIEMWKQAMVIVGVMEAWQAIAPKSEAINDDGYRLVGQIILNLLFGSGVLSMSKADTNPIISTRTNELEQLAVRFRDDYLRQNGSPQDWLDGQAKYFVQWAKQFK